VPGGAIDDQHGVRTGRDLRGDLGQVQVHGMRVGVRQHQPRAGVARGRAGQIAPKI
jgi:hypothetical protein